MWLFPTLAEDSNWRLWRISDERCWLFYRHKKEIRTIHYVIAPLLNFTPQWGADKTNPRLALTWNFNPFVDANGYRSYPSEEEADHAWQRLHQDPEPFMTAVML